MSVFASGGALAQEAPFSDDGSTDPQVRMQSFWRVTDARRALEAGLEDVAYETAREALDLVSEPEREKALRLVIVDSLLASSRPDLAAEWLDESFLEDRSDEIRLRRALIAFAKGDREGVGSWLEGVEENALSRGSLAWLYLMRGWVAIGDGEKRAARELWNQAQGYAEQVSPALYSQISYLVFRYNLKFSGAASLSFVELQEAYERSQGTEIGFRYAQQMAAILADRGERIGATTLIEEQLARLPTDFEELRDEFHLLLAVNSDLAGESGRGAARSLVMGGKEERLMRVCLQHVFALGIDKADERKAFLLELLDDVVSEPEAHPLIDEALYYRSFIGFLDGDYERVELDAYRLLNEYRGSDYNKGALSLLASSAWQTSRYRIAAGLLRQIRDQFATEDQKPELQAFIGDCYFRAGQQSGLPDDFLSAADGYARALERSSGSESAGALFYQLTLSHLRSGDVAEALKALDDSALRQRANPTDVWRAEWMTLKEMRRTGVSVEAYERVQRSLREENLSISLQARFLWLAAKLSIDSGQSDETIVWVEGLDQLFAEAPAGAFEGEFASQVRSSARLALAEAYFEQEEPEEAIRLLETLRQDYPGRDAALLSYLTQARYLSSQNRTVEAQNLLVSLADEYPDSRYAPMALYEAALNAERRGQDAFLTQANQLLQRIAQDYPDSEVVYYARLKQADLSRKLNRFGAAQQIYELLENTYRDRPDRYLAQLYLATTLRAQAADDPSKFDAAVNRLELLVDLPNVPLDARVEAGYQLGVAWEGQGEHLKAKRVYFSLQEMILEEEERTPRLTSDGWYWLSRTLFKLASLLEQEGDIEEANAFYRKIVSLGLNGTETAKARLGISEGVAE